MFWLVVSWVVVVVVIVAFVRAAKVLRGGD